MSHNPPRPQGLDSDATARVMCEIAPPQPATPAPRWRDLFELACWISTRAHMGKRVILSPRTAHVVAGQLRTCHEKPTRDEVALMICGRGEENRCQEPCYTCRGRANIVVNAYGCRPDEPRPT